VGLSCFELEQEEYRSSGVQEFRSSGVQEFRRILNLSRVMKEG
jgi:hypothetical protein